MILMPHFGHHTGVGNCPNSGPDGEDDRAILREADKLDEYPGDPEYKARHPFLVNATTASPMKAWMAEFRDTLAFLIDDQSIPVDPDKFQFAFDTEALITPENHESVKMLAFLADSAVWDSWKVPGSRDWEPYASHIGNPNGQTLDEMYAEMVTATAGQGANAWPADILHATDGLRVDQDHEHPRNRKFMLWWFGVCERAREAVMYNAAYTTLHELFRNAKCSNYFSANYDDFSVPPPEPKETDTWFADKQFCDPEVYPDDVDAWDPHENPQHYTRELPRTCLSPQQSAVLWQPSNLGDRRVSRRRNSRSELDTPELYQMSAEQWGGYEPSDQLGHWSLDAYVPVDKQHPVLAAYPRQSSATVHTPWGEWSPLQETKAHTRLRLTRHTVEASINAGGGGREARMAPWTTMYYASARGGSTYRSAEREYRMILAMLRAKNVERIKFWFDAHNLGVPNDVGIQFMAFDNTMDVLKRVWATEVVSVQEIIGVGDSQPAAAREYTLRNAYGNDVMFSVLSLDDEPPQHQVAIEVVVKVPAPYDSDLHDEAEHEFDFEINLEALMPTGSSGTLRAKDRFTGRFVEVPTMEGPTEYAPDTTEEWESLPSGELRPVRRTFQLEQTVADRSGSHQFVYPADAQGHNYPHMILRIYHDHAGDHESSRFDLLQVIPVSSDTGGAIADPKDALAIADLNADQSIDLDDLNLFVDGFLDENPIADIDSDQDWDQDDIDLFFSAYTYE